MNAKCFHDFDISDWNMYRYSLNKRRAGDEARPKSLVDSFVYICAYSA